MSFVGDRNVDMELMMLLNDHEIGVVCQVNKYAEQLCNDPIFWRKKLMKNFNITGDQITNLIEQFDFDDAKDLYIYLNSNVSDGKKLLLWMNEFLQTRNTRQLSENAKERNNFWLKISKKYPTVSPITLSETHDLFGRFNRIPFINRLR